MTASRAVVIVAATRTAIGSFQGVQVRRGLATLCIGGGQGIAMAVER